MIRWHPISKPPEMTKVLDDPLSIGGRQLPAVRMSDPVLVAISAGGRRWVAVDRIAITDGYPHPYSSVYGKSATHWAHINLPEQP